MAFPKVVYGVWPSTLVIICVQENHLEHICEGAALMESLLTTLVLYISGKYYYDVHLDLLGKALC